MQAGAPLAVRRVAAARGLRWITDAVRLLAMNPVQWFALHGLFLGAGLLCSALPPLGPYLFCLLTPLGMGGLFKACSDLAQGRPIGLPHLLQGVRLAPEPLVTVGGVSLLGYVVVAGVTGALGGEDLQRTLTVLLGGPGAETLDADTANHAATALMAGSALFVPVATAVWFAPALVVLGGQRAWPALLLSLRACMRNLLPLLVYGLGLSLASMLTNLAAAVLPDGPLRIGVMLALLVPLLAITTLSTYFAYRDCFQPAAATD